MTALLQLGNDFGIETGFKLRLTDTVHVPAIRLPTAVMPESECIPRTLRVHAEVNHIA